MVKIIKNKLLKAAIKSKFNLFTLLIEIEENNTLRKLENYFIHIVMNYLYTKRATMLIMVVNLLTTTKENPILSYISSIWKNFI